MDALPYDSPEQLIALIKTIQEGSISDSTDNQEKLAQMANDPKRFIDAILRVITLEDSTTASFQFKHLAFKMACRSLNKVLQNGISSEDKAYTIHALSAALCNNVDLRYIKAFQQVMNQIFDLPDPDAALRTQFLNESKQKLKHENFREFRAYLCIVTSLVLVSKRNIIDEMMMFGDLHQNLFFGGKYLIESLEAATIKDLTELENNDFINSRLEALRAWSDLILDILRGLDNANTSSVQTNPLVYQEALIKNEYLVVLLLKVVALQIGSDKQPQESLFSTSCIESVDDNLNYAKANALNCFNFMLTLTKNNESQLLTNIQSNQFYMIGRNNMLGAVLQSLYFICINKYSDLEKYSQVKGFEPCFLACIEFLAVIASFRKTDSLFYAQKEAIVMNICLPLIASNQQDLADLEEHPRQFFERTANANINDNETLDIKVKAIQLVKTLCQSVDGAASSIIMHLKFIMDYTITSDDRNVIPQQYLELNSFKDSHIIATIEPRFRIEACLLVLASLSNYIIKRLDLIMILEETFIRHFEYFMRLQQESLIQVCMARFLGLYLPALFQRNQQIYIQYLSVLIQWAGNQQPEKEVVVDEVMEVCNNIFSNENSFGRIDSFIADILLEFSRQIVYTKSLRIFDILSEILESFDDGDDVIIQLVTRLVERLNKEYDSFQNDSGTQLRITKIWSLFKIIGKKYFHSGSQEEISDLLTPAIIRTIKEDLPFVEHVIYFISSTSRLSKSVPPFIWEIFDFFPQILKKYNYSITPLFRALSQIIAYGREHIKSSKNIRNLLLDMGLESLKNQSQSVDNSITILYLHLLIQHSLIPEERIHEMLQECYTRLIGPPNIEPLRAKLGEVFLLAFITNFEITQEYLNEDPVRHKYIISFLTNEVALFYKNTYDHKIYIIAISKLLTQSNLAPEIQENLSIMNNAVSLLVYSQHIETQKALKKTSMIDNDEWDKYNNKQGKSLFEIILNDKQPLDNHLEIKDQFQETGRKNKNDESDEDDDYDDDGDDDDEEEDGLSGMVLSHQGKVDSYIKNMVSSIKETDEFGDFRAAIIYLKKHNPELLKSLTQTLSQSKKQHLKEALKLRKIVIDENKGTMVTRRILKPIKWKVNSQNV